MNLQAESNLFNDFCGRELLGQRLLDTRNSLKLTRDDVLTRSKTGFSKSSLQAWENGEREPKLENLYDLANIYGIHAWQLIDGEKINPIVSESQSDFTDDYVYVPAYDVEVSAGHGMFTEGVIEPIKHLAFLKSWIAERRVNANQLAVLFTRGDSMTPTIPENGNILIDMERNHALDGKVYVIRIADRLYVKRTQWLVGGGLRLISDNKLYDPLDITKDDMEASDMEVCGQVIHASYDLPY